MTAQVAPRHVPEAALIYQSVNEAVLKQVPAGTRSLLDVGCGAGVFGEAVKARLGCRVTGLTYSEVEAQRARPRLDDVVVADLNAFDLTGLGLFDAIVCSHVLEHLLEPASVLRRLRACLAPGGSLVIALPNALFWKQRLEFARGRFRYTEGGLMDRTHCRFFDWETARALVEDAGFAVHERVADGALPLSRHLGAAWSHALDRRALAWYPGLFGFQFVLRCVASPAATGACVPTRTPAAASMPEQHR